MRDESDGTIGGQKACSLPAVKGESLFHIEGGPRQPPWKSSMGETQNSCQGAGPLLLLLVLLLLLLLLLLLVFGHAANSPLVAAAPAVLKLSNSLCNFSRF